MSAEVADLASELAHVKAMLEEIRQERDYLRQMLAMSLTTVKQLEAPDKRWAWWQFWRTDA
jgi:hypothetical protein